MVWGASLATGIVGMLLEVGIAFVVGLGAYWLNKKGLLRV